MSDPFGLVQGAGESTVGEGTGPAEAFVQGYAPTVTQTTNAPEPAQVEPVYPEVAQGDRVFFYGKPSDPGAPGQPQIALVAFAYSPEAVNLLVVDPLGTPYGRQSVRFYPGGKASIPEDVMAVGGIATWN